ncbi:hypothetical protein ABVN58_00815 [Fusobacterium polymorphum]|jgi:hypothetical protein|uniref:Uncharacterized protein n=2 Tax=Fusobacterium nucleatum TaxID=851 RepID=A0A3P1VYP4_FUSNU|nr:MULTISPECIES: hypothetical protein [Fusobacterium]ERT48427.1 hypothetical protein HMPREF1767_00861 [Fusobacterium nucleatum CTI-6]MBS5188072.1 hypothetical protein [Fusobacterium nucleatum]OFO28336.1 hypothetical protein HMPREF3051_07750 [Fusobacterium sp. HMSC064B11]RRD38687.1 hypothetical protein EII28_01190 [Fusobacterium nucleatum]
MLKKYFLLVFILLSINTITFSETKNESQIVKENTFNTELPKNEGETKKNIPFMALFDKKGKNYSVKKGLKVTLLLANGHFKMTLNSKSSIAGTVKVNKKSFNDIAKQNFTVTKKNGIYIMKEE